MDLFIGRFQPITKTHYNIIQQMECPVVCIVRGVKSSLNKTRNPFPLEYQKECLNILFGGTIHVTTSTSAYLPEVVSSLRSSGFDITRVHCGSDRYEEYLKQMQRHNSSCSDPLVVELIQHTRTDNVSASFVRESLRNSDFNTFRSLVPDLLYEEYERMKRITEDIGPTNNIGSGEVSPHPKPMGFPLLSRKRIFQDYHKKLEAKTKPKYEADVEDEESRKI